MRRIGFIESNLSGSGFQVLRLAKELGLQVVFLTRNINHYSQFSGAASLREAVDEVIVCETNDPALLAATLRSQQGHLPLHGLMTFADYYVQITAEVARQLELPGLNPAAAGFGRNKLWAREVCSQAGVPCPNFSSAGTAEEARRAAREIGLPCVVKPVDSAASVDVYLCRTLDEVEHHFQKIRARPLNIRGQQRFPRVLIEEFLLGYEVSVETITWNGQTVVPGVTDKNLSTAPYFVETGHTFPSCLPEDITRACTQVARRALDAIQFDFGPAHVELKITRNGPKLVEINPRLAGDRIPDLIQYSLGIPLIQEVVRMHLGEEPKLHGVQSPALGAAIRLLTASPGIIQQINGVDLAASLSGIVEVDIEAEIGSTVRPLRNNTDCLGHVIATAETPYIAARLAEAALTHIEIRTKRGE